ncbi:DUF58 domain-containing protein [Halioglobus sp.]|nr:DUF58 domain-containing protein [Halioglobus sp.]
MQLADIKAPAKGAHQELNGLIALRYPARKLNLGYRSRALSALAGPNKSNFRGRGIDFEEVRSYQPGDDIRTIDWRVTARTGAAHTKLFREERERPVLLVVDQRNSMFFGSRHCFKSVLAGQLASLLAWSALDRGDRVGGLVFNDNSHRELRPRRSRKNVLTLLSEITRYNAALPCDSAGTESSFATMLGNLRRIARPGSSLFLVSDFRGSGSERASEHLFELAKHTELTAIACEDPMESELPRAGNYTVTDGEKRSELHTADKQLRQDYAVQHRAHRDDLAHQLMSLGVPLLNASTQESPFVLLHTYYGGSRG